MRSKTTANLFEKKPTRTVQLLHEALKKAIGNAELKGCWIVYGVEKNGKTWFTLQLAKELARFEKVNYISAEEGLDDSFKEAVKRANITTQEKIIWDEYMTIDEIIAKHKKQRSPDILIIDNLTVYSDEIKPSEIKKKLIDGLPNKLIIVVAHEERKEAYPAIAKMAKKMAKVIFHVVGLKVFITSRFSEGGELIIDDAKSEIFWGTTND
jgi:predicted ATP-dependent serine protease